MPKNRHFGAGSDTMQQAHGAGVNSNRETLHKTGHNVDRWTSHAGVCYNVRDGNEQCADVR